MVRSIITVEWWNTPNFNKGLDIVEELKAIILLSDDTMALQ